LLCLSRISSSFLGALFFGIAIPSLLLVLCFSPLYDIIRYFLSVFFGIFSPSVIFMFCEYTAYSQETAINILPSFVSRMYALPLLNDIIFPVSISSKITSKNESMALSSCSSICLLFIMSKKKSQSGDFSPSILSFQNTYHAITGVNTSFIRFSTPNADSSSDTFASIFLNASASRCTSICSIIHRNTLGHTPIRDFALFL